MLLSKETCVIRRANNVALVDFNRKPEPPEPRFPGANALRSNATEESNCVSSFRAWWRQFEGSELDERYSERTLLDAPCAAASRVTSAGRVGITQGCVPWRGRANLCGGESAC